MTIRLDPPPNRLASLKKTVERGRKDEPPCARRVEALRVWHRQCRTERVGGVLRSDLRRRVDDPALGGGVGAIPRSSYTASVAQGDDPALGGCF